MASELSRFIETELRNKGFDYNEEEEDLEADNPHQSLMGALRVEVRIYPLPMTPLLPSMIVPLHSIEGCHGITLFIELDQHRKYPITIPRLVNVGTCQRARDTEEAVQHQAGCMHRWRHCTGLGRMGTADSQLQAWSSRRCVPLPHAWHHVYFCAV